MSGPPPRVVAPLVDALRADLVAAGYTAAGVRDLLGPLAAAALGREQTLPAQRVTGATTAPVATLVRLFTLGDPVDAGEVTLALPTLGLPGAIELGLVRGEGDAVVAQCDLRPLGDDGRWWVASDLSETALGRPLPPDHVLGVGGASTTLASWTPRQRVGRALDIGTGSGVQALHLAAHADTVTVTDLSERALAFTRFNAALNGMDWEVLAGSMLEPVAGREFDLVVSNPPFVITPRSGEVPLFEYRDAGQAGDDVVADLVRSVGDLLRPGGVAQFLGNWEIPQGRDWSERVREWVVGTGLDAWVVQREVQDPAEYAEVWARDGGHHRGTGEFAAMYGAWLDDFEARGVAAIGFGVVTLQRPRTEREPFVDLVEARGPLRGPMAAAVAAGLAARTWLAEHDDADLLAQRWRVAPDVTEERHGRPGAPDPAAILLRQGSGLGRAVRVGTVAAAYASVADGDLSAEQAVVAIAAVTGEDEATVRAEVLAFVRECAKDGLLVRD